MKFVIAIQDFQKFLSAAQIQPDAFLGLTAYQNRLSRLSGVSNVRVADHFAMQALNAYKIQFAICEEEAIFR